MKEVFEFLKPNNIQTEKNLYRIDRLIRSENFLQGLGANANSLDYDDSYLVTGSIVEACKLLRSQEVLHLEKPWPYHMFCDEQSFAIKLLSESSEKRADSDWDGNGVFEYLCEVEEYRLIKLRNELNLLQVNNDLDRQKSSINNAIDSLFDGEIFELLENFVNAAYYSEFHNSPFWNRVTDFYEVGGLPCGWLGGKSIADGGKPENCLVMCHRNIKSLSNQILLTEIKDIV